MPFMNITLIASEGMPAIAPKTIELFEGFFVSETVISALVVSVLLILFALIVRIFFIPKWEKNTKTVTGFQMFIEGIVNMFDSNAHNLVGHNSGFVAPWYFAAAALICLGTLIEMVGLRPPTSDLNLTLVLGLSTFILMQAYGIKEKRFKHLRRYFPNVINILTDSVVPLSMGLRLFGSIFSGYLIMHLIYSLPAFALVGPPAVASVMFTIFHALIQSYIFFMLSMSFIQETSE